MTLGKESSQKRMSCSASHHRGDWNVIPGTLGSRSMSQRLPTRGMVECSYVRTHKPDRYWLRATVLEVGCVRGVIALVSRDAQPVLGMCRKASHSLRSSCRVLQREADTDAGISPEDTEGTVPWVYRGGCDTHPLGLIYQFRSFTGFQLISSFSFIH